jgi:hypothetical protein
MTMVGSSGGQVSQADAFRPHPSNHESYGVKISLGVFVDSLPIGSIYDVEYKVEVSKFYKYLSAYPVYLNHGDRVFRYLQL